MQQEGTLTVHLKSASGLKAADLNGKSDPYVKVGVGGKEKQSRVQKATLAPNWNETIEFSGVLQDLVAQGLLLKVMDWPPPHQGRRAWPGARQRARRAAAPGCARVCRGAADAGRAHLAASRGRPPAGRGGGVRRRPAAAAARRRPPPSLSSAAAAGPARRRRGGVRPVAGGRPGAAAAGGRAHRAPQERIGLKAADLNGKSDPYVTLAVGRQEKQSHVEKATLSPTWNEELEFTGKLQDLVAHGLLMIVMDWDRGMRDDELGQLHVSLEALQHQDSVEFEERLPTQGSLTFSVSWDATGKRALASGTLHVHLLRAVNLAAKDRNGLSDPYVKLELGGQKKQSKVISKSLNPEWNEHFEFTGVKRDLLEQALQLQAFDKDTFGSDKLGTASVDLRVLERVAHHDFEVPLARAGHVHLRVETTRPPAPPARSSPSTIRSPTHRSPHRVRRRRRARVRPAAAAARRPPPAARAARRRGRRRRRAACRRRCAPPLIASTRTAAASSTTASCATRSAGTTCRRATRWSCCARRRLPRRQARPRVCGSFATSALRRRRRPRSGGARPVAETFDCRAAPAARRGGGRSRRAGSASGAGRRAATGCSRRAC